MTGNGSTVPKVSNPIMFCEETGERYWISGPKKRGGDALYATNITTKIDDDVREEYWTQIRNIPERVKETETL
jgi:hypothetical protein